MIDIISHLAVGQWFALGIALVLGVILYQRLQQYKFDAEVGNLTTLDDEDSATEVTPSTANATPLLEHDNTWLVISVVSKDGLAFNPYTFMQSLSDLGLHFGDQKIFHRHEQLDGNGKKLFSLLSLTKPGTFNPEQVGEIKCVGVSLLLDVSAVDEPLMVFDLMLETAAQLATDLNGQLKAGQKLPWNHGSAEQYRASISAWQAKQALSA